MSEFRAYMIDCAGTICTEVACKEFTQRDVAISYSLAIRTAAAKVEDVDWPRINAAILNRWSMSGLERIKKAAWDLCRGKVTIDNVMRRKGSAPVTSEDDVGVSGVAPKKAASAHCTCDACF